ncbi:MAG: putative polysaccharide biosynthesis protein [Frankiales bacterium]|jgi:FlaA1/EpsC-like NDP-sugar epimerase|nr:putative polysaccharide biosynthesis protein [Frankiales bacterium]
MTPPARVHDRHHGANPSIAVALVRHRHAVAAAVDSLAVVAGFGMATLLRFGLRADAVHVSPLLGFLGIAVAAHLALGTGAGLYSGRFEFSSFEEMTAVTGSLSTTTLLLLGVDLALKRLIPLSAVVAGGMIVLVLLSGIRYASRLVVDRRLRPRLDVLHRVVVFGAGEGGGQAIRAMLRNPDSAYIPVAIVDDDPANAKLRIRGVPVVGTRDALATAIASHGCDTVLIAIPSATAALVRSIAELTDPLGVDVKVLPPVSELLNRDVRLSDMRPMSNKDLLGRHEIEIDIAAVAGYVQGRRILVTGAGGSIGSELCRQLMRYEPERLVLLDRDESALHGVQLTLTGNGLLDGSNLVVADIRDRQRLVEVFAQYKPQVVFHTAALKHLPLLEQHPFEAVKTNIWGTVHVLQIAADYGVERFVNISTDKAADPTSVLGYTKRIGERLTAGVANTAFGTFVSVRFGNVLGSRGSVLTAFRAQVDAGGPITVTHPDVSRFFMTVEEAVRLTIQAAAIGKSGEALVLDMGEPVLIADVARRLAASAEQPIEVVYTGLRPGEKLQEVLFAKDEPDHRPAHPLVSHVPVSPLRGLQLAALNSCGTPQELMRTLRSLCEVTAAVNVLDLTQRRATAAHPPLQSR